MTLPTSSPSDPFAAIDAHLERNHPLKLYSGVVAQRNGDTAQVNIDGSGATIQATCVRGANPLPGDHAVLTKMPRQNQWILIGVTSKWNSTTLGILDGTIKNDAQTSHFHATLSGDDPQSSTPTKVLFDTVTYDYANDYDAASKRWTPPAGKVMIYCNTSWVSWGAGQYFLFIYKNGTMLRKARLTDADADNFSIFCIDTADGGDYYEIYAQRPSATAPSIDASESYWEGMSLEGGWASGAGGGTPTTLAALSDTVITGPSNTHLLQYNGSVWVNVDDTTIVSGAGAVMDADFSGAEPGHMHRTGVGAYSVLKSNLGASVAPLSSDDSTGGYVVGSVWIDVVLNHIYQCADASASNAVWRHLNSAVGTHAASHVDGSDDIQNATAGQKGLATAAQITKLDGIEALADVTDEPNVNAAGAVMHSDLAGADTGPIQRTGSEAYDVIKSNLVATAAPTTGDDTDDGYQVTSVWADVTNDVIYQCIDATASNAVWVEIGTSKGPSYGGISAYDAEEELAITGPGIANKVQVTAFDTNNPSGELTPDHTTDDLTADGDGDYLCLLTLTTESLPGLGITVGFAVFKNNGATLFENLHAHHALGGGGGDTASIAMQGWITLEDGDTVEVWAWNETNTTNFVVDDITLSLFKGVKPGGTGGGGADHSRLKKMMVLPR